jgi:hypothetical protein
LNEENIQEVLDSMGMSQRFEECGKEYLAGYVASKLKRQHPELVADKEEILRIGEYSFVQTLSSRGLTIPSIKWRSQAKKLNSEFDSFHCIGDSFRINMWPGVLVGFVSALTVKYPDILLKATEIFIKTRLFIQIKSANKKLAKIRLETRQKIYL